tara:strand:+ start:501 stop:671 length:171 start_codon:yes stop_codon:yes gene_type:complete
MLFETKLCVGGLVVAFVWIALLCHLIDTLFKKINKLEDRLKRTTTINADVLVIPDD